MRDIKVKMVNEAATQYLLNEKNIPNEIVIPHAVLIAEGWRFLGTEQSRGWCRNRDRTITIPTWVIRDKRIGYLTWYLSHEMAHAFDKCENNHGKPFMEQLMRICPPQYLKYEMNYKGTNATRAGIHSVMEMTLEELL